MASGGFMANQLPDFIKGQCNHPGCDEPARTGAAYYCADHRPAPRSKKAATAVKAAAGEAPAHEVIADVVSDTSSAKTSAPSAAEWTKYISMIVVWATATIAFNAISPLSQPDATPEEKAAFDAVYDKLCLSDDEASSVAHVFGRIIAATPVNDKWGRTLLNNADILDAVLILWMWNGRLKPYRKQKKAIKAEAKAAAQIYQGGMTSGPTTPTAYEPGRPGPTGDIDPDNPPRPSWYQPDA